MALDKKEIALSVVGILAGLALTYLLWTVQQRNAATAAANAATAAANAETEAANQESTITSQVASTGSSTVESNEGVSVPSADTSSTADNSTLTQLDQIISDYTQAQNSPSTYQNLLIPEVGDLSDSSLLATNVPVTATAALQDSNGAVGTVGTSTGTQVTTATPVSTPTATDTTDGSSQGLSDSGQGTSRTSNDVRPIISRTQYTDNS